MFYTYSHVQVQAVGTMYTQPTQCVKNVRPNVRRLLLLLLLLFFFFITPYTVAHKYKKS